MFRRWFTRLLRRAAIAVLLIAVTILGVRIYMVEQGPPLELWHTHVPKELTVAAMDGGTYADYLAAENALFAEVKSAVTDRLEPAERVPFNRYFAGSPVNPESFAVDWNRSFELMPDGEPAGAAVCLHGLTDSPYSLRHLAALYRDNGFVAIGIRLPGHGTVPAGLTTVTWQEWMAAVRLAVREAQAKVGDKPIHLVGYSNGGALAMLYALDAIEQPALARPARIVLFSPMIGVTGFARFSGLAGFPALLQGFVKAGWLEVVRVHFTFYYSSFPVNAARQSYALTMQVQDRLSRLAREGKLQPLAPVLAFQSVLDATVSAHAVVDALFGQLPENGSELVLFDINRHTELGLLFRAQSETRLERLIPPAPRRYRLTVVANRDPSTDEAAARTTEAGSTDEMVTPIGARWSPDVYSLSHVALPFPPEDGLYGDRPDPADAFGIQLGTIAAHGERNALIVSLDWLLRISWNPFYALVSERVAAGLPARPTLPASMETPPTTPPAQP